MLSIMLSHMPWRGHDYTHKFPGVVLAVNEFVHATSVAAGHALCTNEKGTISPPQRHPPLLSVKSPALSLSKNSGKSRQNMAKIGLKSQGWHEAEISPEKRRFTVLSCDLLLQSVIVQYRDRETEGRVCHTIRSRSIHWNHKVMFTFTKSWI